MNNLLQRVGLNWKRLSQKGKNESSNQINNYKLCCGEQSFGWDNLASNIVPRYGHP